MHRVGEFEISRVVEMEVPFVDAEAFLPDSTPDVIQANADWLMPRYIDPESGNLIFAFQSYVIRTAHHTILVDTCIGNDKPRPARPWPIPPRRTTSQWTTLKMLNVPKVIAMAAQPTCW